ncbi:hypothetical protein NBH00_04385 [Paraconexibacter antarcticus]|uniref:Sugar lactone lactonase YvrE n=1 Tax=Paraconexibacter antarcticus TaxID=2949664 RepID=A0ABY5DUU9_9ACTN|nr:hypothetical protein [Paraconexibacter antarcticus]UTI65456.1 hypothetical protein NBH00_04385 [Paraconexibacter antarcticus]
MPAAARARIATITRRGTVVATAGLACAAALLAPAPSRAAAPAADCSALGISGSVDVWTVVGPPGAFWLENIGFDGRGGMWVSELTQNRLVRFDSRRRQGPGIPVASPGASLLGPGGLMYVLSGDSPANVVPGGGGGAVLRFDPASQSPALTPFAAGLDMVNGAAFDPAGNLYVADTIHPGLVKLRPDGTREEAFTAATQIAGADGIAYADGELYVTQFSDPASGIARVPLDDPAVHTTLTQLSPPPAIPQLPDDAAIGPDGALYVAVNTGALVRIDRTTGASCVVAHTGGPVDSVRFASGFPPYDGARDAFLTSEDGRIRHVRLSGLPAAPGTSAPPAARPAMRVSVTPGRVHRGRAVTLHVTVRSAATACRRGVRVRVGRRVAVTDAAGRARLRVRFGTIGTRTVGAARTGCRAARVTLRVVR